MQGRHIITNKGVRFFSDHYNRVDEARKERGLQTRKDVLGLENGEVKDHPWLGRKFRLSGDKDVYTVANIYRQWYCGWYVRMFSYVNDTLSSAEHIIEAEGSNPFASDVEEFNLNVQFIS